MLIPNFIESPQKRQGLLYLLAACVIWAGWWVVNRAGVVSGIEPSDIVAIRFSVAGLILLPVLIKMGIGTTWPRAILLGLLGGLINSTAAIYGVKFAPASHGATLMPGLMPIIVGLLAWLILNESISRVRWLGICIVIAGAFLIGAQNFLASNENQWIGDLLFVGSAISWSFYIICMRLWRISPWQGTALVAVISMIIYLPIYSFHFGGRVFEHPPSTIFFQGLYQGVLTSIGAFWLFNSALAVFGASATAAASALIPALTVILAMIFIGEIPSPVEIMGVLTVIGGLPFAMGLIGDRDGDIHDDIENQKRGIKVDQRV